MQKDRGTPALREVAPRLVFIYNTRDTLWAGMASYLYAAPGALRDTLEQAESEIRRRLGWSLKEELARHADDPSLVAAEHVLEPALTAIQIAMTEAWRERGVWPDATAGSSAGEFAAGYGRGALTLSEALELACRLSRLFCERPRVGCIVLVGLSVDKVEALQKAAPVLFHIAADGWADVTVVACHTNVLDSVLQFLRGAGAQCRVESISVGAHSPLVDDWEEEFRRPLASGDPRPVAHVTGYSPVTGLAVRDSAPDSRYWWDGLRQRLQVRRMIWNIVNDGYTVFLEIGGRPGFATVLREVAATLDRKVTILPTMRWSEALLPVMEESQATLAHLGLVGRQTTTLKG